MKFRSCTEILTNMLTEMELKAEKASGEERYGLIGRAAALREALQQHQALESINERLNKEAAERDKEETS